MNAQGPDVAQPRSRSVGRSARPGAQGLLDAAIDAFYEVGYGGTSVRTIASRRM